MRSLRTRARVWAVAAALGGSLLVLDGCDPSVRDTMLSGVQSAATTLSATIIQAFVQSLQSEEETIATVRAVIEVGQQFFA